MLGLLVALGILYLAFVANAGVSMNNPFYCYLTDTIRPTTTVHSTRTSYEAIRRFNLTTPVLHRDFGMLDVRYGGRYPELAQLRDMIAFAESSIQDQIISNYESGRTTFCRQDFEAIRNWTRGSEFDISAGASTKASLIAMHNIARRFQQNFPTVLPETYSRDHFLFRHSEHLRSNESIRDLTRGLFGETGSEDVVFEDIPAEDWFLTPSGYCEEFREGFVNPQRDAFLRGPEIEEMMEEINRRLGFHGGSNQLNIDQVLLMWEWCRFETANTFELSDSELGDDSIWCAAFSISHLRVLEYLEDLRYFYLSSYGVRNRRLIENINCGLVQDLLTHMQSNDNTDRMARVYVTHTQEILSILVTFGALRDVWPMHQHNYAQQSARLFATSVISPFAANLAVVRYDCDDGDHELIFYLNERPILIPGCDQQTAICKLNFILNRFERFIEADCEEKFCSGDW